ncbi:MAG: DNA repair protein RadC [Chloroflexi bacterium]|nr:DNA repair protein RadC [Chloroflexota bacterium]
MSLSNSIAKSIAKKIGKESKAESAQDYSLAIREMPDEDRPREKLQKFGAETMTDSELLAILLRVGVQGESVLVLSQRILQDYGGIAGLNRAPFEQLCTSRGMGEAKTAQLKAALEIGRRLLLAGPEERLTVRAPGDLANLLMLEMAGLEQENLKLVMLNTKNQIIRMNTVYKGTVNSSQVRVAELFKDAVRHNATSIILAHNHPSGDPTPSSEDIRITEVAIDAGKLLEIELLDHLVIGQQRWVSLREKRLAFKD